MAVDIYYVYKNERLDGNQLREKYPDIKLHSNARAIQETVELLDSCCPNQNDFHPHSRIEFDILTGKIAVNPCCKECILKVDEVLEAKAKEGPFRKG
jgi:hypothetical protein